MPLGSVRHTSETALRRARSVRLLQGNLDSPHPHHVKVGGRWIKVTNTPQNSEHPDSIVMRSAVLIVMAAEIRQPR